jgi:signal transduction histidine kinase
MEIIVESALSAPLNLVMSTVQPDILIADLGELLQPSLAHRDIALEVAAGCPVSIEADADRLRQALINLVNNAADALEASGVVRLGASADPDGGFINIFVEDSGPGLPEGQAESESSKPFGLGLGLTICREIAAHHGGELIASRSEDLGGARFTLRLPVPIIDRNDQAD